MLYIVRVARECVNRHLHLCCSHATNDTAVISARTTPTPKAPPHHGVRGLLGTSPTSVCSKGFDHPHIIRPRSAQDPHNLTRWNVHRYPFVVRTLNAEGFVLQTGALSLKHGAAYSISDLALGFAHECPAQMRVSPRRQTSLGVNLALRGHRAFLSATPLGSPRTCDRMSARLQQGSVMLKRGERNMPSGEDSWIKIRTAHRSWHELGWELAFIPVVLRFNL